MTHNCEWQKADQDLFAVYQTVYSEADVEMWYDWQARLNDTKGSEDCYFLYQNGEKIGGVILTGGMVKFPFLIQPFCDRRLFWKMVLDYAKDLFPGTELQLRGIPGVDVALLMSFGGEIWRPRKIMCRPTDRFEANVDEGFVIETPSEGDIPEIAAALQASFAGGIAYRIFGEDSIEAVTESINNCFGWYGETGTRSHTAVVRDRGTGAIVGGCIAGINPLMINKFSFVDDMFVLPSYRGRGLAEALLKHTLTAAHGDTTVLKLHVLIGNPAESLYRKLGFVSGPTFTDMVLKRNIH